MTGTQTDMGRWALGRFACFSDGKVTNSKAELEPTQVHVLMHGSKLSGTWTDWEEGLETLAAETEKRSYASCKSM